MAGAQAYQLSQKFRGDEEVWKLAYMMKFLVCLANKRPVPAFTDIEDVAGFIKLDRNLLKISKPSQ